MRRSRLGAVAVLVVAGAGCGGTVKAQSSGGAGAGSSAPSATGAGGMSGVGRDVPSMGSASASARTSAAGSSAPSGGVLEASQVYAGNSSIDGAIATDGEHVYWVMQDPSTGQADLMWCPVTGCRDNTLAVFYAGMNWGDGLGELAIANGCIYFQPVGTPAPIANCPLAGCGSGPSMFTTGVRSAGSVALATDGTNIYWSDKSGIYSCYAGATCAEPLTVANLQSRDAVVTMVLDGGKVYWVNEYAATVESAPVAGGPVSTVCTLTPNMPGTPIASTIAVVGGYAYVAGAWGGSVAAGVQRCSLDGGSSTLYFAATGAMNVATDGDYLYWISGQTGDIEACMPGLTCAADRNLPAPGNVGGFVLFGGYAYWTTLAVGRVPLP